MTKRAGRVAFFGRLAQLVRAAGLQPAGRGFESLSAHSNTHSLDRNLATRNRAFTGTVRSTNGVLTASSSCRPTQPPPSRVPGGRNGPTAEARTDEFGTFNIPSVVEITTSVNVIAMTVP